MKKSLLILTILFSFAQSTFALESKKNWRPLFSEITKFDVNHETYRNIESGYVTLELGKGVIKLALTEKSNCPKNQFCVALAPKTHIVELPIVRSFSDWCGSHTYVAELDSTPHDGLLEIIEVTDYSQVVCRIKVPFMTESEYRTLNPWTNEWTQSNFGGERLFFLERLTENLQTII